MLFFFLFFIDCVFLIGFDINMRRFDDLKIDSFMYFWSLFYCWNYYEYLVIKLSINLILRVYSDFVEVVLNFMN